MLTSTDFTSPSPTLRRKTPSWSSVTKVGGKAVCVGVNFPTWPQDGKALRAVFVADDDLEIEASSVGYFLSDDPHYAPANSYERPWLPPQARFFPIKRDKRDAVRFFPNASTRINVGIPSDVDTTREFYLRLELPKFWIDVDLAEFILEATRWHTTDDPGDNPAALAALSQPDLIAYSERMADPRRRQAISIHWQKKETIGETIERALKSTDAIFAFCGLDPTGSFLDCSVTLTTLDTLPTFDEPISLDAAGGQRDRVREGTRHEVTSAFVVNALRRTVGGAVETSDLIANNGALSQLIASELDGDANVVELRAEASIGEIGEQPLDDDLLRHVSDYGHAVGGFTIDPFASPEAYVEGSLGPLAYNLSVGGGAFVESSELGLAGSERFFVIAVELDLGGMNNTLELLALGDTQAPSVGLDHPALYAVYSCKLHEPGGSIDDEHDPWIDEKTSGTARDARDPAVANPSALPNAFLVSATALDGNQVLAAGGLEGYTLENVTDDYEPHGRAWGFAALVKIPEDNTEERVLVDTEGARHAVAYDDSDPFLSSCWAEDTIDRLTVVVKGGRIYWRQIVGIPDESAGINPLGALNESAYTAHAGGTSQKMLLDDEWTILVVAFDFAPQFALDLARSTTALYDADHLDNPVVIQDYQQSATVFAVDPTDGSLLASERWLPAAYEGRQPPLLRTVSLGWPYPGSTDFDRKGLVGDVADWRLWQFDQTNRVPLPPFLGGLVRDIRSTWNYT